MAHKSYDFLAFLVDYVDVKATMVNYGQVGSFCTFTIQSRGEVTMNIQGIDVCTDSDLWVGYALAVVTGIPYEVSQPTMEVHFIMTLGGRRVG